MSPLRPLRSVRRPSCRSLPRVLAVLSLLFALTAAAACSAQKPFYLGGIQVNEPDVQHWVRTLDAEGMNTVSVTAYAKQGDWDTANLWWDDHDEGVLAEIRAAEKPRPPHGAHPPGRPGQRVRPQPLPLARHDPAEDQRPARRVVRPLRQVRRRVGGDRPERGCRRPDDRQRDELVDLHHASRRAAVPRVLLSERRAAGGAAEGVPGARRRGRHPAPVDPRRQDLRLAGGVPGRPDRHRAGVGAASDRRGRFRLAGAGRNRPEDGGAGGAAGETRWPSSTPGGRRSRSTGRT